MQKQAAHHSQITTRTVGLLPKSPRPRSSQVEEMSIQGSLAAKCAKLLRGQKPVASMKKIKVIKLISA